MKWISLLFHGLELISLINEVLDLLAAARDKSTMGGGAITCTEAAEIVDMLFDRLTEFMKKAGLR